MNISQCELSAPPIPNAQRPIDRMQLGALVRIVRLDERGLRGLDDDERARALSMVGETFEVEEIDEYGRPNVWKRFPGDSNDSVTFHSIALDPDEFELVRG